MAIYVYEHAVDKEPTKHSSFSQGTRYYSLLTIILDFEWTALSLLDNSAQYLAKTTGPELALI